MTNPLSKLLIPTSFSRDNRKVASGNSQIWVPIPIIWTNIIAVQISWKYESESKALHYAFNYILLAILLQTSDI